MRLDLFLKASRLSGRRTLAQKICDAGRVSVNGSTAKSSHAIKAGDEISIRRHHVLTTVRVRSVALGALPRLPSLAMIPRCPGFSLAGRRDSARAVSTRKISACAQFRIRGERIPAERELGP